MLKSVEVSKTIFNPSDLILSEVVGILTYMTYRPMGAINVNRNFINDISQTFLKFVEDADCGISNKVALFEGYAVKFTTRSCGDGLDVSIFKKFDLPEEEEDDCPSLPEKPIREKPTHYRCEICGKIHRHKRPFYASPYEHDFWYNQYHKYKEKIPPKKPSAGADSLSYELIPLGDCYTITAEELQQLGY